MSNRAVWRNVTQLSRQFTNSSKRLSISPLRTLTGGEQVIFDKLNTRFRPSSLDIEDVSGGCGTFYAISIKSGEFKNLSMVKQHRLVTEALKAEIPELHGLQINTKAE